MPSPTMDLSLTEKSEDIVNVTDVNDDEECIGEKEDDQISGPSSDQDVEMEDVEEEQIPLGPPTPCGDLQEFGMLLDFTLACGIDRTVEDVYSSCSRTTPVYEWKALHTDKKVILHSTTTYLLHYNKNCM